MATMTDTDAPIAPALRRSVTRSAVPVFYDRDLPNGATHCRQAECGFSLYRGVLVQWDEDHDPRVLNFIDELGQDEREHLLVAQEHEGSLSLLWDRWVPPAYAEGEGVEVDGDYWCILESKAVQRL